MTEQTTDIAQGADELSQLLARMDTEDARRTETVAQETPVKQGTVEWFKEHYQARQYTILALMPAIVAPVAAAVTIIGPIVGMPDANPELSL